MAQKVIGGGMFSENFLETGGNSNKTASFRPEMPKNKNFKLKFSTKFFLEFFEILEQTDFIIKF